MSDAARRRIEGLGPPIKGPTALGSDPRRLLRLTWTLAVTDFKLRFFGSVLGYLWQLMRPLMLFGVLYIVFSVLLNFGGDVRFYPVALLLGHRPVLVPQRGHRRARCAAWSTARTSCARSSSRAWPCRWRRC